MDKRLPYPHERRKKVTRACDYCKKRKFKCIGQAPCDLCKKKNIPCEFSIVDRRTTKKNDESRRKSQNVEESIMNPAITQISNSRNGPRSDPRSDGQSRHESNEAHQDDLRQPPLPPPTGGAGPLPIPLQQHPVYQPYQYQQMHSTNQYGEMENEYHGHMNGYAAQSGDSVPPVQYGYPYPYANNTNSHAQSEQSGIHPHQSPSIHQNSHNASLNQQNSHQGQIIMQNSHHSPLMQQNSHHSSLNQLKSHQIPLSQQNSHHSPIIQQKPHRGTLTHANSNSGMNSTHQVQTPSTLHPNQNPNSSNSNPAAYQNNIYADSTNNSKANTVKSVPKPPNGDHILRNTTAVLPPIKSSLLVPPVRTPLTNQDSIPSANRLLKQAYIPKSLQPLLSFPLETSDESGSEADKKTTETEAKKEDLTIADPPRPPSGEIVNDNAEILLDSRSSTRYIGESSPLSLLHEARNIFHQELGESEFSSDTQGVNINDEPVCLRQCGPAPLPLRELCDEFLKLFHSNINQSWYIFHKEYFVTNVVDYVYEHGYEQAGPKKTTLLHLSLALGILFAEISRNSRVEELPKAAPSSMAYFESGFNILRKTVDDGRLWLTEAYFLIYFYYQSSCNRSSSWLMLGDAIRNAQALGLHRRFINKSCKSKELQFHRRKLWLSLYVCDRISSILLGRPLLIFDYDWDDFNDTQELVTSEPGNQLNLKCLVEIAKISKLNGKTILNFYLSGKIDPSKAEKLAIEYKIWSMNLPPEIQIDKILNTPKDAGTITSPTHSVTTDNFLVFALHLSQLFGIMLLSRPFFMYIAFKHKNHVKLERPKTTWRDRARRQRNESTMNHFCKASVKSSVLTIQMISFYMGQYADRLESYPAVNCTFMAGLVLGLSILHRRTAPEFEDEYDTTILMKFLETSRNILTVLSPISVTAYRFSVIITKMKQALEQEYDVAGIADTPVVSDYSPPEVNEEEFNQEKYFTLVENDRYDAVVKDEPNEVNSHQNIQVNVNAQQHQNTQLNQTTQPVEDNNPKPHEKMAAAVQAAAAAAEASAATGAPGTNDMESLLDLQHYFQPRTAGALSEDNNSSSSLNNTDPKLDNFMYNIGTSDILFDNNL